MQTLLWLAIGAALVAAFVRSMPRVPSAGWLVVFGGGALLVPLVGVVVSGGVPLFTLVKTVSVGAAGLGVAALRFGWGRPDRVARTLAWVLIVNILEAVVTEAATGHLRLNALTGLALIATLGPASDLRVDGREVNWPVGWDWVLVYSLWNAVFVYSTGAPGEAPGIWMWVAVLHLGLPLVLTAGRAERYLELRVLALFVVVCWVDTFRTPPWVAHSEGAWSLPVAWSLHGLSVAAGLALVLRHLLDPTSPESIVRRLRRSLSSRATPGSPP